MPFAHGCFNASRVCTLDANHRPRPKVGTYRIRGTRFYFNTESETQVIEIRAMSQLTYRIFARGRVSSAQLHTLK